MCVEKLVSKEKKMGWKERNVPISTESAANGQPVRKH